MAATVDRDAVASSAATVESTAPMDEGPAARPALGSWERYYDTVAVAGGTQFVSCAPSHVCVVRLAPAHPAFGDGVVPLRLRFAVAASGLSGKKKRGAVEVMPDDVVAHVECESGETFPVVAGIRGRVLELNEAAAPADLLGRDGYVAIVLAHHKDVARLKAGDAAPAEPAAAPSPGPND